MLTRWISLLLLCFSFAAAVCGQEARLQMGGLAQLEAKAVEVLDVTVDERMLRLGSAFLSARREASEAKIKELLTALKGVYVKVFEFDRDGEYSSADLDELRAQLHGPGWTRIVNVRSRSGSENVEVYLMGDVDKIQGVAVISAEPRELVIVNIVGPIDLEKISELEGHFGIPQLELKLERTILKE
jgi:hypothetical protein